MDGSGNLYIADMYSGAVKKWTAATQAVTTLASLGVSTPAGVALDKSGNIYIAEASGSKIQKVNVAFETLGTASFTVGSAAGGATASSACP